MLLALATLGTGCDPEPESTVLDQTEYPAAVRIVEVLATPTRAQPAFIELRNDSEQPSDMRGWALAIADTKTDLRAVELKGAVQPAEGPGVIPPHGLALVVDDTTTAEAAAALACEAPIATTRQALGREAADDVLASTLELQSARHCIPVFSVPWLLEAELGNGRQIALVRNGEVVDRVEAAFGDAPRGVAFERRRLDALELSPIGATPGARNFFRADQALLHDGAGPAPLQAMSSSPWRVGDAMLDLERKARAAELAGDTEAAASLRAEITAIEEGSFRHNPLVEPFDELLLSARRKVAGSFFQINDSLVIETLVSAKSRGVDVRLTTDAGFLGDEHYTAGFDRLEEAGIPLVFDLNARNVDRASLSHNKFVTIDKQWLWTGSFNPVEDEPARIHADNVITMRSPAAVAIHDQEFETMFGGTFSTDKRKVGLAGGRFNVDGAEVSVRFSPGMTKSVLQRRAKELTATGDAKKACDVRMSNGKPAIPDRYKSLDPCGGPYDLIMGELARATSSIYFVSFSLSLDDMGAVIGERMQNGVEVKGVVDPTVYSRGIIQTMTEAGADVRITPNSNPECPAYVSPRYTCPENPNKVWLHHKFVVIDYGTDHPVVITGSHNLSASAEDKNDESLLVIRDRAIAEAYFRIFYETYEHPQNEGVHRLTDGLPPLAITEVLGSVDPDAQQLVEITNVSDERVSLAGLELWNRRDAALALGDISLEPGARVVVTNDRALGIPAGTTLIDLPATSLIRPVVEPTTALVLRNAADGRWVATFNPYSAEQNLPAGVTPAVGAAYHWNSVSVASIRQLTDELLGVNLTPDEEVPTWSPRGFYSDWADEHHVTPTSLVLMQSGREAWSTGAPTPGT